MENVMTRFKLLRTVLLFDLEILKADLHKNSSGLMPQSKNIISTNSYISNFFSLFVNNEAVFCFHVDLKATAIMMQQYVISHC